MPGIVDTDVHPSPRSVEEIRRHLPHQWRETFALPRRPFHHNQDAPLCLGRLAGTTAAGAPGEYPAERDGEILTCPGTGGSSTSRPVAA